MTICDFCGKAATKEVTLPVQQRVCGHKVTAMFSEKTYDICDDCLEHLCNNIESSLLISKEDRNGTEI